MHFFAAERFCGPDTILPAHDNCVSWCHFNTNSIYPLVFEREHLESLLPKYPGLEAWRQALAAGDTQTGCTVHYVDLGMDTGEVIAQEALELIEVKYEVLPHVTDVEAAMAPDAPMAT